MATIDSVKLPDNSTYDLTDNYSGYQKETLATPLTINGTQETTVEGALSGLNDYGDALADNLAANENVYGAKNLIDGENASAINSSNTSGTITNTVADSKNYIDFYAQAWNDSTPLSDLISPRHISTTGNYSYNVTVPNGTTRIFIKHNSSVADIGAFYSFSDSGTYIFSLTILGADPSTIGGFSFNNVMLRDERITDDTFVPFAKTNKQLTEDKAERKDLTTIFATGATNNTGVQINAGAFFYLDGVYCKAKTNIAANAAFTLNTNYKKTSLGGEIRCTVNELTIDNTVMSGYGDGSPTNILGVNNEMLNGDIYELVATSTGLELNKYSGGVKTNIWTK